MKKTTLSLSIISIVSILLLPEIVSANTESIKIRLKNQESRIQIGHDKGQLDKEEKKTLNNEQQQIKNLIKKLSKDKDFSISDRQKVKKALDKASLHIFKIRYKKMNQEKVTH